MEKIYTLIFGIMILLTYQIKAQTKIDTINSSNNTLNTSKITESTKEYLVYLADGNKNRKNIGDIWKREIRFKEYEGKKNIEFEWNWYIKNGQLYKTVTNLCDRNSLAPIYHKTVSNQIGDSKYDREVGVKAYDFIDNKMLPADSIKTNIISGKAAINLDIPVLSLEIDLETFALLPISKVGQQFAISFFDPSEQKPEYHLYEVVGKDLLQINNDTKIECWLLKTKYDEKNYAQFWLTDKSKEVVKMEEYFNGFYRIKELLY